MPQRASSLWSRSKQQLARQKQQEKLRDDSLDEQQQAAVNTALDEATELIRCSDALGDGGKQRVYGRERTGRWTEWRASVIAVQQGKCFVLTLGAVARISALAQQGVGADTRTLEPAELKGLGAAELMRCATPMRKVESGRRCAPGVVLMTYVTRICWRACLESQ